MSTESLSEQETTVEVEKQTQLNKTTYITGAKFVEKCGNAATEKTTSKLLKRKTEKKLIRRKV